VIAGGNYVTQQLVPLVERGYPVMDGHAVAIVDLWRAFFVRLFVYIVAFLKWRCAS
jgi:hypothetical protein